MTRVSQSYYSTAVNHLGMPGSFFASFAIPGERAMWVHDTDGSPKIFRSEVEAEVAGYRVMMTKLNRARAIQCFEMKGHKRRGGIKAFRATEKPQEYTVESVFGGKKKQDRTRPVP